MELLPEFNILLIFKRKIIIKNIIIKIKNKKEKYTVLAARFFWNTLHKPYIRLTPYSLMQAL